MRISEALRVLSQMDPNQEVDLNFPPVTRNPHYRFGPNDDPDYVDRPDYPRPARRVSNPQFGDH